MTELLEAIESTQTAASLSVVSSRRAFRRILATLPVVQQLVARVREDRRMADAVFMRLVALTQLRVNPRYANPHDVALAAYLAILGASHPELSRAAAEAVMAARNCWWATGIAEELLFAEVTANDAHVPVCEQAQTPPRDRNTYDQKVTDTGDSSLFGEYLLHFDTREFVWSTPGLQATESTGLNLVEEGAPSLFGYDWALSSSTATLVGEAVQ